MKYSFLFLLSIALFFGCSNANTETKESKLTITGKVTNPQEGLITLQEIQQATVQNVDTITLSDDNTFSLGFNGEPGFYRLNFYGIQSITVVLDNSDITVNVDGANPRGFYEVIGSSEIDQIQRYNEAQNAMFGEQEKALNQRYGDAKKAGNEVAALAVQAEYMDLLKEKENLTVETIRVIGANLAAFQLLSSLDKDKHFDFVDSMATELNKKYTTQFFIKDLVSQMEKARMTAIGREAPEISLPTPDGNILTLSSLRGQVVLVDFWAQWCKPCRMENPNVVAAYHKFKDKGFTVYGVSLDRTKDKWLQAIEEDGLTWNHVSDLKYFNSIAAETYGITGIPFSILLDREGKIVAKNLRGAALEQALEKVFAAEGK